MATQVSTPGPSRAPIWIIVIIVIIVAVIIWWKCPVCTDQPDSEAVATLVIEEEHAVSWMPLDNGFSELAAPPPDWERRSGFLIQLGIYWEDPTFQKWHSKFSAVTVEGESGSKTYVLETSASFPNATVFDWMNVVAVSKTEDPPISAADADTLFRLDKTSTSSYCPVEHCITTAYDPTPGPLCPSGSQLSAIRFSCLRFKSLHGTFTPGGIITYWFGENGYELTSQSAEAHNPTHIGYTFEMMDPIRVVEVWKDGTKIEDIDLGAIKKIVVLDPIEPGEHHGEIHQPPTDE